MFINLTPHEIHEVTSNLTLPACPTPARIGQCSRTVATTDGITIFRSEYSGQLENLPDPVENVIYIVSALALNAVPADRTDVVCPGNAVRDRRGRTIGCQGFRCR